jgi:hypothetical protein
MYNKKPENMIDNIMKAREHMKIYLLSYPNETGTPGDLIINRKVFCHTLEDVSRPFSEKKIPGQTAIYEGTYEIVLSFSNRFQKVLPEILNVPRFSGIRMHGGNTVADTEGCILTAYNIIDKNTIQGNAVNDLINLLKENDGRHYIQIIRTA